VADATDDHGFIGAAGGDVHHFRADVNSPDTELKNRSTLTKNSIKNSQVIFFV
jgi:hypothetical protein